MSVQKAIAVVATAQPVKLIERPIPKPGPGEVLVKVSIAGLNPHDGLVREIAYFVGKDNLPGVLAIDIVGEIVQLGEKVSAFKIGDKVMGQGDPVVSDTKGSQEYAVLDADFIAPLPDLVSPDQADTVILNPLTAYVAVLSPLGLDIPSPLAGSTTGFDYKNTSIVIIGGSSACGRFAIQLAKWVGIGTIVTVAGKHGEGDLKSLGATHVIDRSLPDEDIQRKVREIVGDDLLYVLDCNNRADHTQGIRMLSNSKKGTMVPLAVSRPNTIDEAKVGPKQQGYNFRKFVCRPVLFREIATQFYKALPRLIDDGVLKPTSFAVIEGLDVDKINAQLDKWRDGQWPPRVNIHVS
ncbi:Alcohol dehydrogenase GroES-like domain-containing protein [Cladophialophora immunda]|nr:Alcohol dehydrogenase GroES-like domain-containing protein [Cladophialophora immunda]